MGVSTIPASGGGGLAPKYVKYTSSGTFTLPDGYGAAKPLLVSIQVLGGGGGGAVQLTPGSGTLYAAWPGYFGQSYTTNYSATTSILNDNDNSGGAGGSGGLCATQLYLTANLSFTIGAAGTAARTTGKSFTGSDSRGGGGTRNFDTGSVTGGTGGITTASVLQATGGVGGVMSGYLTVNNGNGLGGGGKTDGAGGTPAGTTGMATPLLGTLGGGSTSATPIRGSFGVGGIKTDLGTSTGADGTGGGQGSIGASGAVILTYWS